MVQRPSDELWSKAISAWCNSLAALVCHAPKTVSTLWTVISVPPLVAETELHFLHAYYMLIKRMCMLQDTTVPDAFTPPVTNCASHSFLGQKLEHVTSFKTLFSDVTQSQRCWTCLCKGARQYESAVCLHLGKEWMGTRDCFCSESQQSICATLGTFTPASLGVRSFTHKHTHTHTCAYTQRQHRKKVVACSVLAAGWLVIEAFSVV